MGGRRPIASLETWVVRRWVRAYTWDLPRDVAERRRGEVDSDLWEHVHDPESRRALNRLAWQWAATNAPPDGRRANGRFAISATSWALSPNEDSR